MSNKPEDTNPEPADVTGAGGGTDVQPNDGSTPTNPPVQPEPQAPNVPQEPEPQATQKEVDAFTLDELNQIAGREGDNAFKSKEDFQKHYGNLKSFVGKANQTSQENTQGGSDDIKSMREQLERESFLRRNPDIKEGSAEYKLLNKFAQAEGTNLDGAYQNQEFKDALDLLRAGQESKSAETSVESNQRVGTGVEVSDELKNKAAMGDSAAQEEYVMKSLYGKSDS